jgi:hypothetical protein
MIGTFHQLIDQMVAEDMSKYKQYQIIQKQNKINPN